MAKYSKSRPQSDSLFHDLIVQIKALIDSHKADMQSLMQVFRGGVVPAAAPRRGRPPKNQGAKPARSGRRPGRQPVIIRDSSLTLKPRQLSSLKNRLQELAGEGRLGKDATVFAIAHTLSTQISKSDKFTAGDVIAAYDQLGTLSFAPPSKSVDAVQMLRNLAAKSIGKEWVKRNEDGTFSLTTKGLSIGESGKIVRPRGRRPGSVKPTAKVGRKKAARRGRPPGSKNVASKAPVKRGPGRPRKNA